MASPTTPATDHLIVRGTKGKGAGRSLHTACAYKPGDLVALFTDPLLVLPNGPSAKSVCNHCLAHQLPTKACTGCQSVAYCGPTCQKANWALIHKLECKVFRKVRASVDKDWLPTPVRALVQVLLRWDADETVRNGFGRLEGNVDGFKKREDVWKDVGLQAYGGMKYAGRKETDDQLHMTRDILCKVSAMQSSRNWLRLTLGADPNELVRQDRRGHGAGWHLPPPEAGHGEPLLRTKRCRQLLGSEGIPPGRATDQGGR